MAINKQDGSSISSAMNAGNNIRKQRDFEKDRAKTRKSAGDTISALNGVEPEAPEPSWWDKTKTAVGDMFTGAGEVELSTSGSSGPNISPDIGYKPSGQTSPEVGAGALSDVPAYTAPKSGPLDVGKLVTSNNDKVAVAGQAAGKVMDQQKTRGTCTSWRSIT